ncbi:hypothetical protein D3C76_1306450 [compost metagenome]
MGEKCLADRVADLVVSHARQQIHQIRHPAAHGSDTFGLQLFLVGIEVVCQAAEIGIQQQGAVVETAVQGFAIGRSGDLPVTFWGFHHQVIAPGRFRRRPQRL